MCFVLVGLSFLTQSHMLQVQSSLQNRQITHWRICIWNIDTLYIVERGKRRPRIWQTLKMGVHVMVNPLMFDSCWITIYVDIIMNLFSTNGYTNANNVKHQIHSLPLPHGHRFPQCQGNELGYASLLWKKLLHGSHSNQTASQTAI